MSCEEEPDEPFFPSIWGLNINWLMLKTRYFTHTKNLIIVNLGVTIQPYKMAQIKMLTLQEDTMMLGKIFLQLQSKVKQVVAQV